MLARCLRGQLQIHFPALQIHSPCASCPLGLKTLVPKYMPLSTGFMAVTKPVRSSLKRCSLSASHLLIGRVCVDTGWLHNLHDSGDDCDAYAGALLICIWIITPACVDKLCAFKSARWLLTYYRALRLEMWRYDGKEKCSLFTYFSNEAHAITMPTFINQAMFCFHAAPTSQQV